METVLPPLLLTLRVAATSMVLIAAPAFAAAYLLARRDFRGKAALSTFLTLPLVLPPTAIGFLRHSVFAYDGPLGRSTLGFDPGVLLTSIEPPIRPASRLQIASPRPAPP